jgi:hypothetical protein
MFGVCEFVPMEARSVKDGRYAIPNIPQGIYADKFDELNLKVDELLRQIPGVDHLLAIKGIGRDTVAGFLAVVGEIAK